MLGLEDARHVDHPDMAVRIEPRVGSQLARADLKLQFHRGAIAIACDTALANISRTFAEGSDEGEDSRPCLPHAGRCAALFEIEDASSVYASVNASRWSR